MKKQFLIISLFAIAFILMLATAVNAAEHSVDFTPSKQEAKVGETFTIEVVGKSEFGIEAFGAIVEFDSSKLQLVNAETIIDETQELCDFCGMVDENGKPVEDENGNIITDYNRFGLTGLSSGKTEKKLPTLEFKVLDSANEGETLNISLTDIKIATSEPETEQKFDNKTVSIKVKSDTPTPATATLSKIEISAKPTKTSYTEGDKFDKTGMKVTATYSDGTSKEITNYTISPNEALKTSDKKVTVSYTEGSVTKTADVEITVKAKEQGTGGATKKTDGTEAGKDIPNTGLTTFILPIGVSMIIALVSYIMYKKHNKI